MIRARPYLAAVPIWLGSIALAATLVGCGGSQSYDRSYGGSSHESESTRSTVAMGARPVSAEKTSAAYAPAESGDDGLWDEMLPSDDPVVARDDRGRVDKKREPAADGPDQDAGSTGEDGENGSVGAGGGSAAEPAETPAVPLARMIIYTGAFEVFVLDIDGALDDVRARAEEIGGWMKSATAESITLRIPVESFEDFVAWLDELGRVTGRDVVGVDVTEEFYDLEIRLQNAQALRARYRELLAKATTVEDTLKIEAELARITEEIERIKGRIRFLAQHASFSTITVHFYREPEKLPQESGVRLPFRWLRTYRLDNVYRGY